MFQDPQIIEIGVFQERCVLMELSTAKGLAGFLGNEREMQPSVFSQIGGIEFSLLDYLALVEALGQVVRPNKRGYIPACDNTILERLNMNAEELLKLSESFGGRFRCAVGAAKELESYALASP